MCLGDRKMKNMMHQLLKINKSHWIFLAIVIISISLFITAYAYWVDARSKTLINQVRSQLIPDIYREHDTDVVRQDIDLKTESNPKGTTDKKTADDSCVSCAQHGKMKTADHERNKDSSANTIDNRVD